MSAYAAALAKGNSFLASSSLDGTLQSTREYFADFTGNGWRKTSTQSDRPDGSSMHRVTWKRECSGQLFDHTYDVEAGMVRVNSVVDPLRGVSSLALPDSTMRSDLTSLDWRLCSRQDRALNRGLRSVELCNITNKNTLEVIDKVFENIKDTIKPQPGRSFLSTEGDEFKALLGVPDAYIVSYLLDQHRKQLGRKRVESIRVYCDSLPSEFPPKGSMAYFMVFNISVVPGSEDLTDSDDEFITQGKSRSSSKSDDDDDASGEDRHDGEDVSGSEDG